MRMVVMVVVVVVGGCLCGACFLTTCSTGHGFVFLFSLSQRCALSGGDKDALSCEVRGQQWHTVGVCERYLVKQCKTTFYYGSASLLFNQCNLTCSSWIIHRWVLITKWQGGDSRGFWVKKNKHKNRRRHMSREWRSDMFLHAFH